MINSTDQIIIGPDSDGLNVSCPKATRFNRNEHEGMRKERNVKTQNIYPLRPLRNSLATFVVKILIKV